MINTKIESLQILRFIAAILVVTLHLGFEFGHIGVDIFFVLSGFIIAYVTNKKTTYFFINRLIRVIPIYWLITIIFTTALLLFPNIFEISKFNYEYLFKSLLFIPFDNLDAGHYPLVIYGWTLNYEIYFYLIFSLAILISKKNVTFTFIIIFLIIYFINLVQNNFISEVYTNPIIFEFMFGVLIFIFYKNFSYKTYIFILIFILTSIYLLIYFNDHRIIMYGIPSVFILILFLYLNKFKFHKYLVVLGDSSYCLYLIHPYIFQLSKKLVIYNKFNLDLNYIILFFNVIICILISICLHKYFEIPIQKFLKNKIK